LVALSHQAGLQVIDAPVTFEEACGWDPLIRALGAVDPEARVGFGYVSNLWAATLVDPRAIELARLDGDRRQPQ
jgi:hypothetical protein